MFQSHLPPFATPAPQRGHRAEQALPWAALALAAMPRRPGALALHLGAVVACYGAAKLLELGDHAVFAAAGYGVSGHSFKHLFAAAAALPVLTALHSAIGGQTRLVKTRVQNGAPGGQAFAGAVHRKSA